MILSSCFVSLLDSRDRPQELIAVEVILLPTILFCAHCSTLLAIKITRYVLMVVILLVACYWRASCWWLAGGVAAVGGKVILNCSL